MESLQTHHAVVKRRPEATELHENLKVVLETLFGGGNFVVIGREEEGVDLDGGGDDENVADHVVENVAAGGLVRHVCYVAEFGGVVLAFLGEVVR